MTVNETPQTAAAGPAAAMKYPLLEALLHRRSRRFARGVYLNGGPLQYRSEQPPQPLSVEEEALLTFAATGINGYVLGDLPYQSGDVAEGSGGNLMVQFGGRTIPSADNVQGVTLFILNDDGAWMLKRPQDYQRDEIPGLVQMAHEGRFVELYERARVRIADQRLEFPRETAFVPPVNKWGTNRPGTTYFLPVNEYSALYLNVLLTIFDDEYAYFVIDDRNHFQPAGVAKFGRTKGGHLHDNPHDNRYGTVSFLETSLIEKMVTVEQGAMIQGLALMTQALGLGGFPHYAFQPYIWLETLGFRMRRPHFSRVMGTGPVMKAAMKLLRKDLPMPTATGLERDGEPLIKPFCPPYYRTMSEAVEAFVDFKYAQGAGTFRDGGAASAWKDGAAVQSGIPRYSDRAIDATKAYCEYIYRRYGRFPMANGPFQTAMAYQAHHLDPVFYDRFFQPGAMSDTQRAHEGGWHTRQSSADDGSVEESLAQAPK